MTYSYPLDQDIQGGPASGIEWFYIVLTILVLLALLGAAAERARRALKTRATNFVSIGSIILLAVFPVPVIISCLNTVYFHSYTYQHAWEAFSPLFSLLYLTIQIEVLALFQHALKMSKLLRPILHVLSCLILFALGLPYYYQLVARGNLLADPVTTGFLNSTSLIAGYYAYLVILDMIISAVLLVYLIKNIASLSQGNGYGLVYQLGTVAVILTVLDFVVIYLSFKTGSTDRQFAYSSLFASDMQGIHYICGTYYLSVFSMFRARPSVLSRKAKDSSQTAGVTPSPTQKASGL